MPTFALNSFVSRQTADSRFSHFEGSSEELLDLIASNFDEAKPGYKDGILLVPVPCNGFFSGVVEITPETTLRTTFEARREGEAPFVQIEAVGAPKLPALVVDIVLYSHDALAENDENSTDLDWEVVSINARPTEEPEPLTPVAMARNFLDLEGGTKAEFSADDFAQAIIYWSSRAMCGE